MEITMKKFARLAAVGALGVAGGVTALFLVIAIGGRHTPTSGLDATQARITLVSALIPAAAIVAVHVVYAVQLWRYAKEHRTH